MRGGGFKPPVEVGEELDVVIEAVGEKGDGIAKIKGFVLFIPNVKEGDTVRVKVTKVLQKVGFADVVGETQSAPGEKRKTIDDVPDQEPEEEGFEDTEDFGEEEVAEETQEESEDIEEE